MKNEVKHLFRSFYFFLIVITCVFYAFTIAVVVVVAFLEISKTPHMEEVHTY